MATSLLSSLSLSLSLSLSHTHTQPRHVLTCVQVDTRKHANKNPNACIHEHLCSHTRNGYTHAHTYTVNTCMHYVFIAPPTQTTKLSSYKNSLAHINEHTHTLSLKGHVLTVSGNSLSLSHSIALNTNTRTHAHICTHTHTHTPKTHKLVLTRLNFSAGLIGP